MSGGNAHGVTSHRAAGKSTSSNGAAIEFQPGTPSSKWWELHGFELDGTTTAAPAAASTVAPAASNRLDKLSRRRTSFIDAKPTGSIEGGDKTQRLVSRGSDTFQRRKTFSGPALPPLETTSASRKSAESDPKRNNRLEDTFDSRASRSSADKIRSSMAELQCGPTEPVRSFLRSKSIPNKLLSHAPTFRNLRSRKTERSTRALPSISTRDVTEGQSREKTPSMKLSRRDSHARTAATMSPSPQQPLDRTLPSAASSCNVSRDLVSYPSQENILTPQRMVLSAEVPPQSVREDSDSEDYEEIGNGWSATFEMAGRMEAMMDMVYNGAKNGNESGNGKTPDEGEAGHAEGEQDGGNKQQDAEKGASADGQLCDDDLNEEGRTAGKLAANVARFADELRDAKRKRYLEAVYLSFGVHGKWEPEGISSPDSIKASVVRLGLKNFEKVCKSSNLMNFTNLPPARVWKIFMTISKGDTRIDFEEFLQALAEIASCTGRDIEYVHDAVAKINKQKLMWIGSSTAGDT